MKRFIGSAVVLLATAGVTVAATTVEVNTPGASVRVGAPPPPPVVVVNPGNTVIVKEKHDNGKHKGQKKHKKHKNEKHEGHGEGRHK